MALPSSTLPGHRQLHERVIVALGRCQENQDVDFKEAGDWVGLKWKIIRTSMAMANLRDGGVIVVGVSERNHTWSLTGVDATQLATFEPDVIVDQVNKYASPAVALDIVQLEHEGLVYVAIQPRQFSESPIVCKRNGPDGSGVSRGRIYIRPSGKAETSEVRDAQELHDLLELAAERRMRRTLEMLGRVGLLEHVLTAPSDAGRYDEELEGL